MHTSTLSIILLAYNEAVSIADVAATVVQAVDGVLPDYEILIFNDASTDDTGAIIDRLAAGNPRIRALHNPQNMNVGYCVWRGIELARMQYVCALPGDNDLRADDVIRFLRATGTQDVILSYPQNNGYRKVFRRLISRLFVRLFNQLFHLSVRYFNGPAIVPTAAIRLHPRPTDGFACIAEMVVTLLKTGHRYAELPIAFKATERKGLNLRAFQLRNFVSVASVILRLRRRFAAGTGEPAISTKAPS